MRCVACVLAAAALVAQAPLRSAVLDTPTTFDGGTLEGWWQNDGGIALDAGQGGIGDHVLNYTASVGEGFFAGTTGSNFTGDLESAGAYAFEFDAKFVSGSDLSLRVFLLDDTSTSNSEDDFAVSSTVVTLSAADTNWHHYAISISPEDVDVIRNEYPRTHIQILGLRHDPEGDGPTLPNPVGLTTTVYFDNFMLSSIPEPGVGATAMAGLAVVGAFFVRRRSHRKTSRDEGAYR